MCQRSSKLERRFMMKKILGLLFAISILTACANASELTATQLSPESISTDASPTSTSEADPVISAVTNSAELSTVPAPICNSLTQSQTEGPYYIPNTPERHSLLEEGMLGTRLILVGYVLDQNCQPLPNAWLDFW